MKAATDTAGLKPASAGLKPASAGLKPRHYASNRSLTRAADFVTLAKPRLNFLVIVTTLAAYYLGGGAELPLILLFHTAVGTAFVAAGASALNQVWERETDRLMERTRRRPLPDARLHPRYATWFGVVLSVVGVLQLALGVNLAAAAIALATLASYVFLYTPLKLRTSLSTIVGAVPGALPALIGWVAATNRLSIEGWTLCGIVFIWQMPHFLAIAWMYRDDYANAGFPMLPVIEPDGRSTGRQVVLYSVALVPVSFLPSAVGLATAWYLVGAMVLGAILLILSLEFSKTRSLAAARRLFFGTILYLPLLWMLLITDHFIHRAALLTRWAEHMSYADLPAVNAALNATSAVFLSTGYVFIRRRDMRRHRACMLAAFVTSALFLTSYVIYHLNVGSVPFQGQGAVRTVYFAILITHVLLAFTILPLALTTLSRGLAKRFDRHRKIARVTLPLWLYVSITGVVIYVMLYQLYP